MYNLKKLSFLLSFCFLIFLSAQASAHVSVSLAFAPAVIEAPHPRYVECYVVPAGLYNGVWINAHRVCNYVPRYWRSSYVEYDDMRYYHRCHHHHHHRCGNL